MKKTLSNYHDEELKEFGFDDAAIKAFYHQEEHAREQLLKHIRCSDTVKLAPQELNTLPILDCNAIFEHYRFFIDKGFSHQEILNWGHSNIRNTYQLFDFLKKNEFKNEHIASFNKRTGTCLKWECFNNNISQLITQGFEIDEFIKIFSQSDYSKKIDYIVQGKIFAKDYSLEFINALREIYLDGDITKELIITPELDQDLCKRSWKEAVNISIYSDEVCQITLRNRQELKNWLLIRGIIFPRQCANKKVEQESSVRIAGVKNKNQQELIVVPAKKSKTVEEDENETGAILLKFIHQAYGEILKDATVLWEMRQFVCNGNDYNDLNFSRLETMVKVYDDFIANETALLSVKDNTLTDVSLRAEIILFLPLMQIIPLAVAKGYLPEKLYNGDIFSQQYCYICEHVIKRLLLLNNSMKDIGDISNISSQHSEELIKPPCEKPDSGDQGQFSLTKHFANSEFNLMLFTAPNSDKNILVAKPTPPSPT